MTARTTMSEGDKEVWRTPPMESILRQRDKHAVLIHQYVSAQNRFLLEEGEQGEEGASALTFTSVQQGTPVVSSAMVTADYHPFPIWGCALKTTG